MPVPASPPPTLSSASVEPVRAWTLGSAEGPLDVEISAPDDGTVADVLVALSAALGAPVLQLWAGSAVLPADTPLSANALAHGAVLGLGRPGPRQAPGASSGALELHVSGGPDAGRTVPLGQGSMVLGRSAGCGLPIADPDVSRRHAVVSVAEGRVTVTDLGSSNGTSLSAAGGRTEAIGTAPREWPVGAALRIGSTTLRLTGPGGAPLAQTPAGGGRRLVRPLGATPRPPRTAVVRLPAPPATPSRRRLGWVAVTLPAVGGLLMAWLLSTPQFLFFALLSPLVAVAGWASDRLTGRRAHRRAVADHAVTQALADAELAAAVATDLAEREDEHPDPARLAAAARRRCSPLWSRTGPDPLGLAVRLGVGAGPSAVTRIDPDGTRSSATAEQLPVTVLLGGGGGLGIVGPRVPSLGVARALVCQLAVLASPAHLDLVLVCSRDRAPDWAWARWLPHLRAVVLPGDAAVDPFPDPTCGAPRTVVVLDGPVDPVVVEAVTRASDRLIRLDVAESEPGLALPAPNRVEVTGETGATGRLRQPGAEDERVVTLDAVSRGTATDIARDLAALTVPMPSAALPDAVRLLDLPGTGLQLTPGGDAVGGWERSRDHLLALLGADARGPRSIDLVADGPHALVAGTTGAGKSELLQTLVTSLALRHAPDRCSFLLVDYKGGAAFGEAARLPHTVGVLTDLDHQSTARALRSLSAELTRRERLLAEHRVRDLGELPEDSAAARLVIVVDEFATLAEELPAFVSGLVGIAQRGRSLGVHLVLATQRPAGVVSPEIRANCSLRICLRTTDEGDSRDVLGTTAAAHLSPGRPGRAYLRTGSDEPVLFQVARVSGATVSPVPVVTARRRPWPPVPVRSPAPAVAEGTATDLQRVVTAVGVRARRDGLSAPGRPWLPPLPVRLTADALDPWTADEPASRLHIGLLDRPDDQLQEPLTLDLAEGGGWLLVGGPRSGRTTTLRTVLTEAVRRLPPSRLHVHVLDHGGGALASAAAALPHCGTAVDRNDVHRGLRLLSRLGEEVDRRRGSQSAEDPLVLVLVDGHESLAGQLESADPATGATGLLRLVRDGAAVGVTVVITAERAVPGGRLTGAVRTRLVLPLPDRADYAVAGVAARSVPGHRPAGRALVGEDAVECQLVLPRESASPLVDEVTARPVQQPIRVTPLPADPELPPMSRRRPPAPGGTWLPLGPGGDEGDLLGVRLERTGGLLVAGPSGSGRSSALGAFALSCAEAGAAVLHLGPLPAMPDAEAGPREHGTGWLDQLDGGDVDGVRAWTTGSHGPGPAVVVADDLMSLPDPVTELLATAVQSSGRLLVLASGTAAELAGAFRGPAAALRRTRTALLLGAAPGDAELLGLRTPRTPLPARPGAGWLVTPAGATRIQVARRRRREAR